MVRLYHKTERLFVQDNFIFFIVENAYILFIRMQSSHLHVFLLKSRKKIDNCATKNLDMHYIMYAKNHGQKNHFEMSILDCLTAFLNHLFYKCISSFVHALFDTPLLPKSLF